MARPRTQTPERRWPWWGQARDAIAAIVGAGILVFDALRDRWNAVGVAAALSCLGIITSGVIGRWLLGRFNGNGQRP